MIRESSTNGSYREGLRDYAVALFDAWQHLGAEQCLEQIELHLDSNYPDATLDDVCFAMDAVDPLILELCWSDGEAA